MEALGLCETDAEFELEDGVGPEMEGYGEPMPCEGINRDEAGFRPYVGTSLSTKSSGTVDPFESCG